MKQLSTEMIGSKPVSVALMEATGLSQEFPLRELAIFSLAAIDEVGKLFDVLSNEGAQQIPIGTRLSSPCEAGWAAGLNRASCCTTPRTRPACCARAALNATEAETLLILLHDFSPKDSRSKETFEYLVHSLHNNKLAIRQLAYWHLLRLSQGLREFPPYDPDKSGAARDMMAQKWEKLWKSPRPRTPVSRRCGTVPNPPSGTTAHQRHQTDRARNAPPSAPHG